MTSIQTPYRAEPRYSTTKGVRKKATAAWTAKPSQLLAALRTIVRKMLKRLPPQSTTCVGARDGFAPCRLTSALQRQYACLPRNGRIGPPNEEIFIQVRPGEVADAVQQRGPLRLHPANRWLIVS